MAKRKATVGKKSMTSEEAKASAIAAGKKRKAVVVGGTGIMPSASVGSLAGLGTSKVSNVGSLAGRGTSQAANVGSLSDRGTSQAANVGSLAGRAKSDVPYQDSIPKAQADAKMSQIEEQLAPYKTQGMEVLSQLQMRINNATTPEEINAIIERIKASTIDSSGGM